MSDEVLERLGEVSTSLTVIINGQADIHLRIAELGNELKDLRRGQSELDKRFIDLLGVNMKNTSGINMLWIGLIAVGVVAGVALVLALSAIIR